MKGVITYPIHHENRIYLPPSCLPQCGEAEVKSMNENLRKRKAAGVSAVVNTVLAIVVLMLGRNLLAIFMAIFLLGWAIAAARKWQELRHS